MVVRVVSFRSKSFPCLIFVAKVALDISSRVVRFIPRSTRIISPLINVNIYLSIIDAIWWRSWLKPCTTSRKVAGSISDGVFGILH
jgi:hypothetical protein